MARDEVQLAIARAAATLFLEQGVAATAGDAIARAAGVSTRTVWRHFRNKESCVGPLLDVAITRFARVMRMWPLGTALKDHLRVALLLDWENAQTIADGRLAVGLVALAATDADIRRVWLDAYHQLEEALCPVLAERCNRAPGDFDVRLCAATMVAAIRVVDARISIAALRGEEHFAPADLADILAGAIEDAATLPICGAITPETFGARSRRVGG